MRRITKIAVIGIAIMTTMSLDALCYPAEISLFDKELHKVRYNVVNLVSNGNSGGTVFDDSSIASSDIKPQNTPGYKSPGKAFLLSLAVPGLGQYYYGSKVKAAAFVGVEAAAWIFHVRWHNDGNDLTDEFEQFNQQHWIQDHYEDYLEVVYGSRDDDSISAQEVSHNLPDTRTQQYYEMTGKYDQFAWGWDDAILYDSVTYNDWGTVPPPAITGQSTTPYSARRFTYEEMRDNANKKFDDADKMIMVAVANHAIAAVEAFITTRNKNGQLQKPGEFSSWKIKPTLKSYNSRRDTPYLKITYKF